MKNYPFWSFVNITALDAPLICVAWCLYYNQKEANIEISHNGLVIIALSVWLGYMADRLLDVKFHKSFHIKPLRHKFCKRNNMELWILWYAILFLDVFIGVASINSDKYFACIILICLTLLYQLLNQCYYYKRIPKELFISILLASATLILFNGKLYIKDYFDLSLIYFINCLVINYKDKNVDRLMGSKSLAQSFSYFQIIALISITFIYFTFSQDRILNPFASTTIIILSIQLFSKIFNEEQFRIAIEFTYFVIPIMAIITIQ